jgi:hypothetical protein
MLIVIMYSCVMSAYFVMFDFIDDPITWWWLENASFAFFLSDLCFNVMRQYRDIDGTFVTSHKKIIVKYLKSGWLILDVVATFPFYLLES